MSKKIRTRRTFPVTVTRAAPKVVVETAASRRARIFCPTDTAFSFTASKRV